MPRARNIKPGFYKNEHLAECSILARFIFPGLWMLADRCGRLEDRPKRIKGELLPYDTTDVDKLLTELEQCCFIERYVVEGKRYIQICNFEKHQYPHVKEAPSAIPAPDKHSACTVQKRLNPESLILNPESLVSDVPESPVLNPEPLQNQKIHHPKKNGMVRVEPVGSETWNSYTEAYSARYGTPPVRNATINSQIAAVVKRLGQEEAPAVAAFYLGHNTKLYVAKGHPVGLLLQDCEKLRTEWATGRKITEGSARTRDLYETNAEALREYRRNNEK